MAKKHSTLGDESYDEHEFGTEWWAKRARDRAHTKAYRRIVDFVEPHLDRPPKRIIDFACGPGLLLRELLPRFPDSRITAIDESRDAIEAIPSVLQRAKLGTEHPTLRRLQRALPDFDLGLKKADLVFFLYPDFRGGATPKILKRWKKTLPEHWAATKALREDLKAKRKKWAYKPSPAAEVFFKRLATINHRALVKKGALVVRVDYGQCARDDVDPTILREMAWCEGIEPAPKNLPKTARKGMRLFDLVDETFVRSPAIMKDVYAQTGDPDDLKGGYLITVLRAR